MKSYVVNNELRESVKRKEITQTELSNRVFRAKTTVNGYFRGDPAPLEALEEMAHTIDDSLLSQNFSHRVFDMLPPMESDTYQTNPMSLDIIQMMESNERKALKQKAMFAMAKQKGARSQEDTDAIQEYAFNFLDEVLVEMRYIVSILEKVDMSLMSAIKQRMPDWKAKKYVR
ncbi:hypothetical protein [Atopococcus tabaci]|uniref:hypothetical protein n=1 Tax=Atopococcus tabaci TaxID=269774 RepID=UPI00240A629A|nr:hypothetical protein [Atopococcus tabaci]